jgi:transglutaminase-like putative cysteine protease
MKPPALLLGAALIFWGWQTGLWLLAALMALIFEGSRFLRFRWDLSRDDFKRISDLCTILFVILLIYILVSDRSSYFILVLFKWLPIVLFPLLAAQAYSTSDRIDISTLFLFLRKKKQKEEKQNRTTFNPTYPYFAICILSASAANARDIYFYIGMFGLLSLTFWFVRSKRFSPLHWICLIAIAGGAGAVGHIGLHGLQLTLEQKGLEWFSDFNRQDSDPFQTKTAIGDIGSLKPSSRIVFRVKPDGRGTSPMLLREATYNWYSFSMWLAPNSAFTSVQPVKNGTTWRFKHGPTTSRIITVSSYLYKGQGVLKLPDGTFQIDQLPVVRMEGNKLGTVKVEGGPGRVTYQVQYHKGIGVDSPPTEIDLQIPAKEKKALNKIADQLGLEGKSPRQILKSIETFFQQKFSYSLVLTDQGNKPTPLSAFLLRTRSGHCEYFATATALLLRTAGIPVRYVKGYSVHEFSQLENRFIVRDRHAHAWTLVHIDGAWHKFDTTPASWASIEDAAAPAWEFISDLWSWGEFKLSEWLRRIRESGELKHLGWLMIPFSFIFVRRFYLMKRVQRFDTIKSPKAISQGRPAGSDSEFYLIENALIESGFVRQSSETLQNWIEKLQINQPASHLLNDLRSILDLHYRHRFDPKGINTTERAALKSTAQSWLDKYNKFKNSRIKKP